jgi:hypothetical protein
MSAPDPADQVLLREQIQTAIAAGRELGPDMDPHLADSVLDRYTKERAARAKVTGMTAPSLAPLSRPADAIESFFRGMISLILLGALLTAIVFTGGKFWWLAFFIGPMIGSAWGWHGRSHRHSGYHAYGQNPNLEVQERDTRRRLKIERMQAEINRLKSGNDY